MNRVPPNIEEIIAEIIDIARLAPSVHNTQPWRISVSGNVIAINLDHKHMLRDGDPTGRQTFISLGIFTKAIIIAANKYDFYDTDVKLDDDIVKISFRYSKSDNADRKLSDLWASLLAERHSDRSVFKPIKIKEDFISELSKYKFSKDVEVRIISEKTVIQAIAEFTSKGIGLAMEGVGFRSELSHYLILPWSSKKRGISVKSLYINQFASLFQPLLIRTGFQSKAEMQLEKKRWLSASADVVILANGDLPPYWLQVGMAYLIVSLLIEKYGYAQATSAAVVEAADYHEDIEAILKTSKRLLAIVRIGKGSQKKYFSPRLSVTYILTTS